MSFSGLKTAIRLEAEKLVPLTERDINDLCAAIQQTVAAILEDRCNRAMERFAADCPKSNPALVVAGGVAANSCVRRRLSDLCDKAGWHLVAPPAGLCTDNAAMIAWAALERFERGEQSALDAAPRSRWPLDEKAERTIGSGRRGVKV